MQENETPDSKYTCPPALVTQVIKDAKSCYAGKKVTLKDYFLHN